MYQPEAGRWHAIDPLVENYMDVSPCADVNPVLFVDPNGVQIWLLYTYWNKNDEEVTSPHDKLQALTLRTAMSMKDLIAQIAYSSL